MIKAAGVVLWREREPLQAEVALIHRVAYDDWTFPKGKAEQDESLLQAAYRECIEETGFAPIFGGYLGDSKYNYDGEKKRVFYWMAQATKAVTTFTPNAEVDKLSWMSVKEARHFLTYDEDRDILRTFVRAERHSKVMIFLRHAKAIKRNEWFGEDSDRPLSHIGQLQSAKIAQYLKMYGVDEVHSSDAIRCMDTARTVADQLRLELRSSDKLNEDYYERDDNAATEYVDFLINSSRNLIVCGHNPIFQNMLLAFENGKECGKSLEKLSPAEAWVIHHIGRRIVSVDSIPAPVTEKTN